MKRSKDELIQYRIQRAHESLNEAKLLAENYYWNTVANRLYYSCFYMVNALLSKFDILSKSHSGIKAEFHKSFVKKEIFKKEFGKLYSELFDKRQEGDYQDFYILKREDVEPLINKVELFIDTVEKYINTSKA